MPDIIVVCYKVVLPAMYRGVYILSPKLCFPPVKCYPFLGRILVNCLVTVCISFIFWLNNDYFSLGYFIRRISGTIKRFWCIRYGINIEVKIRDCPGAFGTDGGSAFLECNKKI